MLDQLESRGLVQRRRSAEDRRAIKVHLTAAGEEALRTVVPLVVDRINQALKGFTHTEVDELLRLLNKLILGWQDELAESGGPA